ncbi:hypothetical protein F5X68DRAFT_232506 [Plectosphaerella plurivora]|uniref:NAD(P)-binding protein n=1 Tax=Plectosphaerella plurivora TaxID=936078 RepID=A0A9P8VCB8_9PEZI|nr:hypothetical protein F5X68DRAFT_232506 [Plectosphaerella plurivora]
MSRFPGQEGSNWGEASDSYAPYIPKFTSSHSRPIHHDDPPAYHPPMPSQTVLVAGCSAGTGLDVAGSYAASGARIMFTSRGQEALDRTPAAMTSQYPEAEIAGRLHDFADEQATWALWRDLGCVNVFIDVLIPNVAKK